MARQLPPLNAVRVFVVVARTLSFTRAADELAVTHSAVSKQVATLEDFIGAKLFYRDRGRITLTDEGQGLRDAVSPAMSQLGSAFQRFRRPNVNSNVFRIATVASFAAHILMPNLPQLRQRFPTIEFEFLTSDRPLELDRESVDLAIRHNQDGAPEFESSPLVPGILLPVVATEIAEDLAEFQRIQTFGGDEWLGVDESDIGTRTSTLDCRHLVVAIEAVLSRAGVALLPDLLVKRFIEAGRMHQLAIDAVSWPTTFHLIHDSSARNVDLINDVSTALRELTSP